MDNMPVKPSRIIKPGDVISFKTPPIIRSYKTLQTIGNRMGAKLVPEFIQDITPADQLNLLEMAKLASSMGRPRGLGRPTKKDRRDWDDLMDSDSDWE